MVKAQELCPASDVGQLHCPLIWPILNDDLDVVEFLLKRRGKIVERLDHEMLKSISVHGRSYGREFDDGQPKLFNRSHYPDELIETDRFGDVAVGVEVIRLENVLLGL